MHKRYMQQQQGSEKLKECLNKTFKCKMKILKKSLAGL